MTKELLLTLIMINTTNFPASKLSVALFRMERCILGSGTAEFLDRKLQPLGNSRPPLKVPILRRPRVLHDGDEK